MPTDEQLDDARVLWEHSLQSRLEDVRALLHEMERRTGSPPLARVVLRFPRWTVHAGIASAVDALIDSDERPLSIHLETAYQPKRKGKS